MAIDFPNAPTIGQSFTSGNQTWVWDGVAWAVTDSPVPNAADYVLRAGDVMTGQLQVPSLLVNVDASVAGKLILAGDPVQPLQAATKAYVDALGTAAGASYLKLTGGTLTGNLIISHTSPTLTIEETDVALNTKRWGLMANAAVLYLRPLTDAGVAATGALSFTRTATGLTDALLTGAPLAAPAADSLMTMGRSDARFARYRDDWVTGSYPAWNIVNHHGGTWISTTTTSQEPGPAATQWDALGGASGAYVGATPPTNPVAGQLWYCTVAPVGLFVWFVDVDSGQWVSTDGSGGISQESADGRYLKLTGGVLSNSLTIGPPDAANNPALWLKRFDATNAGVLYWDRTNDYIGLLKRAADGTTAQATLFLTVDDIITTGLTATPASNSLMTRARVEARSGYMTSGPLAGKQSYLFTGIPAEATEVTVIVHYAGPHVVAGSIGIYPNSLNTGYVSNQARSANGVAAAISETTGGIIINIPTASQDVAGVLRFVKYTTLLAFDGAFRIDSLTQTQIAGSVNIPAGMTSLSIAAYPSAFTSGDVHLRWRI